MKIKKIINLLGVLWLFAMFFWLGSVFAATIQYWPDECHKQNSWYTAITGHRYTCQPVSEFTEWTNADTTGKAAIDLRLCKDNAVSTWNDVSCTWFNNWHCHLCVAKPAPATCVSPSVNLGTDWKCWEGYSKQGSCCAPNNPDNITPECTPDAPAECNPKTEGNKCCGDEEICTNGKCVCNINGTDKNWNPICCGIKLNTNVPFIWNCIYLNNETKWDANTLVVTPDTAFPRLMTGLTKILVTVILLASFVSIVVAGVMMAASGDKEEWYTKWTKLIWSVITALAILWASGVILRLINPNFFG